MFNISPYVYTANKKELQVLWDLGKLYVNNIYLKKLNEANEELHTQISGGVSEASMGKENLTTNASFDLKE